VSAEEVAGVLKEVRLILMIKKVPWTHMVRYLMSLPNKEDSRELATYDDLFE